MKTKYLLTYLIALTISHGIVQGQTKNVPLGNNGYSPGYNSTNILGGQQIPISKAPYQASMKINGSHACGGTIISDRWILTAAHCVVLGGATISNTYIQVGSNNQTTNSGQIIAVDGIYPHQLYSTSTNENDVALLHLASPIQFNIDAMPIEYSNECNTNLSDYNPGNEVYLSGWGITCSTCAVSTFLQGLTIPIISNANAMAINQSYNPSYTAYISSNMLSFYNPGTGAGPGDSGGPAMIDKNGNQINIGASSWGYWPKDQLPTVYTNIRNYAPWIESKTGFSISASGIDLYSKDKPWDMGFEPSNVDYLWESEDIWVRRQNDGIINQTHQNPEYYSNSSMHNYIYMRVRNRGCSSSNGTEKVKLYWSKAGTALGWPNYWDGSIQTSTNQPLGGYIGEVTLPVIEPGDAAIVSLPWNPVNPADYVGAMTTDPSLFWAEEPHHFCLLGRIIASGDPMTSTETSDIATNVNSNNNIVWKNLSVVDLDPNNIIEGHLHNGATIVVGDAWGQGGVYDFEFTNPPYFSGNPLTTEAEIKITLDKDIWDKWKKNGFKNVNIKIIDNDKHQIIITGNHARINELSFTPNERGLMHLSVNFLTRELSEKNKFDFDIIQRKNSDNSILGGELYTFLKHNREVFYADAGNDKEIEILNNATLSAYPIGEPAIYNWYDHQGNLIFTGKDFSVSPEITTKYKLEVVASSDGFKDYDEVKIKVKQFFITSISPNPANSIMNIEFKASNANSAYFMITPLNGGASNQYIIDPSKASQSIDVSNYQTGQYVVVLICNGEIRDYKNILIQ